MYIRAAGGVALALASSVIAYMERSDAANLKFIDAYMLDCFVRNGGTRMFASISQ